MTLLKKRKLASPLILQGIFSKNNKKFREEASKIAFLANF
jgi:hypothetical protein